MRTTENGQVGASGIELAADAPLRADARRNLARVLEAAEALFAEEGPSVSIDAIAHRAGVGVGTVYRRFPTKAALGEAIVEHHLEQVIAAVTEIAETTTPADVAFFAALDAIVAAASNRRDLKATIANVGVDLDAVIAPRFADAREVLAGLLVRAQETGAIRDDLAVDDVVALLGGICATGDEPGGPSALRLLALVTAGFQVPARASTPSRTLELPQ